MQSVFFQFFQYQHRTAPTRGIFSLVPALRRLFLLPTLPVPPPPGKMLPDLLTAAALLPYTPEHLPVCAILHTLLALAAALLFLYNLFYLSLQLYLSSPAPARYSQTNSNTAFFSKLTHPLDSPAARGRLCLLLLWISCVFCLDSWILSGIINSAMEICLTLTAGVLFWLFFPSLRLASNHPHSLL